MKLMTGVVIAALAAFVGCSSYRISQTNHFADDNGAIVRVNYGKSDKDHVNTFRSPANGREFEFKTRLVVEVLMPDGEAFTAWQCMNLYGPGTAYRSDDEKWLFLAFGFTCQVHRLSERVPQGYRPVFSGVLCNTPVEEPRKDTRWHRVKAQDSKLYKK